MNDKKKKIIHLIETYVNHFHKTELEEFYGGSTKISIKDILYSSNQKSILIDCKIVLGDLINEEIINRELVDVLLQDALNYLYPDESIKISIDFDV